MSALVSPICGHASHLYEEIDKVNGAPHIHVHHLTSAWEANEYGLQRAEMCCHGCGASCLVVYSVPETTSERASQELIQSRDEFFSSHRGCRLRVKDEHCMNFRSSFIVLDLRDPSREHVKIPDLPHPSIISKPNRRVVPRPKRR